MDNQHTQIDSHELAWLAGVVESDGSIYLTINRSHPQVDLKLQANITFCNSDQILLNRALAILTGIDISAHIRTLKRNGRKNNKIMYQIDVSNQTKCKTLLEALYPYLLSKRNRADLLLEFIKSRMSRGAKQGIRTAYDQRELQIAYEMKVLNQRGVTQTEDRDLVLPELKVMAAQ